MWRLQAAPAPQHWNWLSILQKWLFTLHREGSLPSQTLFSSSRISAIFARRAVGSRTYLACSHNSNRSCKVILQHKVPTTIYDEQQPCENADPNLIRTCLFRNLVEVNTDPDPQNLKLATNSVRYPVLNWLAKISSLYYYLIKELSSRAIISVPVVFKNKNKIDNVKIAQSRTGYGSKYHNVFRSVPGNTAQAHSDPDLNSGGFWIRIQIQIRNPVPGFKKSSKMLNNNIILLFCYFYNNLSFHWLLLMRKSYNYELIFFSDRVKK